MNCLGNQFLARPGCPRDQHRGTTRRDLLNCLENLPHCGRLADDILKAILLVNLLA